MGEMSLGSSALARVACAVIAKEASEPESCDKVRKDAGCDPRPGGSNVASVDIADMRARKTAESGEDGSAKVMVNE